MCNKRVVQIRLTERQYERVILRKEHAGYNTVSQFVRDLMLKEDIVMLNLVQDIHKKILGEDKHGKKK